MTRGMRSRHQSSGMVGRADGIGEGGTRIMCV